MKLLVVSGGGAEREPGGPARRVALARAALLGATRALLVREAGEPLMASVAARFETVVELDSDQLAAGLALDGVARDFQPDSLVALGSVAARAVGRLTERPPCWLDLPAGPVDSATRRTGPPSQYGRESDLDYWHELLWALDRADRISCSTELAAQRLEAMLALRGRFAALSPPSLELQVVPDPPDGVAALADWVRSPRRRGAAPRILGAAEISDLARGESLAAELAAQRSRLLSRAGETARRAVRVGHRAFERLVQGVRIAAAAPVVALDAARLSFPRRSSAPAPAPASSFDLADLQRRLGRRPRLLIVMPYRIFPPRHGGAVRLAGLLERLSASCELHLLRLDQRGENRIERVALERYCRRVEFSHWIVPPRTAPRDPWLPPSVTVFADERVAWRIRHWVESERIDVVQLEYVEMAQYRGAARPARVILVEHDLAFRSQERRRRLDLAARFSSEVQHRVSRLDLLRLRRYELGATRSVDQIHLMSAVDAAGLARFLPDGGARMRLVPNTVDTAALAPDPRVAKESDILFVGNFANLPNRDALEWLIAEIWPRVRAERPQTTLTVVGAELPPALRDLAGQAGARVAGEVADLGALYRSHRVLAVPLRAGSGTRLKILEAFAAGIPVVSTALGAEGIDAEPGVHLAVADDAAAFAGELVALAGDARRCEALSVAARGRVTELYDVARAAEANLAAVLELACEGDVSGAPVESQPVVDPLVDVAIVIPTRRGGALLERVLAAIGAQKTTRSFEVVCIDSGSSAAELDTMARAGARVVRIPPETFDHGRTRDQGAAASRGRVLVFLNQDAVPMDELWLDRLTAPLFAPVPPAAVQGGIREFADGEPGVPRRLYWDSGGPRFNFTRESRAWIARHGGIGFSTVNCAMRRDVWREVPFGRFRILEDKLWQGRVVEREHRIVAVPEAAVKHTHDYDLVGLVRRSVAEGEGWRRLGERYRLRDAVADALGSEVWRAWRAGVRARRLRTAAEWLFPLARPFGLWRGNARAGREIR